MENEKSTPLGFPCRSCGNRMVYSPALGALVCPYCKQEEPIKSREIEAPEYHFDPDSSQSDAPMWEEAGDLSFVCPACGAETVQETLSMTVTCPFCGSQYVNETKTAKPVIRPETMIPFSVAKEEAARRYAEYVRRRFFAPRAFKKSAKAEALQGIYVPYFTFDADLACDYSGRGGRNRTVTETVRVNGKTQVRTRTVTDWYPIRGHEERYFDDTPVCASKNADADLLRKIRPFSLKVLHVYNPAYLAGFIAERYSIGLSDSFTSLRPLIERDMESYIRTQAGYDTYAGMVYHHHYRDVRFKHILLPVWTSSFTYKQKRFPFMVNGETGKVAGRAPVSPLRVLLAALCLLAFFAFVILLIALADKTGGTALTLLSDGSPLVARTAGLLPATKEVAAELPGALPDALSALPAGLQSGLQSALPAGLPL